ncbi:hypothetical protein MUK42_06759 [Musa troglodytarum]|uniref:Uncharacterized protein n=1 Tax=Musa troglodytarum TaxID=320322 RepID=A0A9E7H5G1_9LILI|nr:hypothetical protein MUK42_06759 [Musa troglodytarum]URE27136.1 hypothetical protein MUK42_06759 [Musa troglodytarum]
MQLVMEFLKATTGLSRESIQLLISSKQSIQETRRLQQQKLWLPVPCFLKLGVHNHISHIVSICIDGN